MTNNIKLIVELLEKQEHKIIGIDSEEFNMADILNELVLLGWEFKGGMTYFIFKAPEESQSKEKGVILLLF
ncbi:hypothetical protein AAFF39_05240 [Lactococcus garvieae]